MNQCPLCNSVVQELVGKPQVSSKFMKFIREDYHVARCGNCGYYYVTPRIDITEKEWQILYEDEYFVPLTSWWQRRREKDRINRLEKMLRTRIKLKGMNKEESVRVLDIGCGEGYYLSLALQRNWQAYGCDIADNLIPGLNSQIEYHRGNILSASYPSGFFDFIYMDSVLEHVVNPVDIINEIKRILSPVGVAYIAVPNENSLYNDVKRVLYDLTGKKAIAVQLKPFTPPYHINGFSPASLRAALTKSDLYVYEMKTFAGEYEWLRFPAFSSPCLTELGLLPVYMMGRIINRAMYLEAYIINNVNI